MLTLVRRVLLCAAVSVALAHASPAHATLAVPMPAEDLAADADAIVTGHVTHIVSHWDPHLAQIVTTITIDVDDILKGELDDHEVVVTQPGGTIGSVGAWLEGSPEFERGEKVLVFLTEQPDGSVRVSHLYLGKYSIQPDEWTGGELAVRDPNPAGVHVLPGPRGQLAKPGPDASDVYDLKARIAANAYRRRPGKRLSAERMKAAIAPEVSVATPAFKFYPEPARWFEPDFGQAVSVKTYAAGEPLAPTKGFDQIRAAMNAWSTVPGSSFRYVDGGTTTSSFGITMDGVNAVSFRDPLNQIGSSGVGCRGILAVGGHFYVHQTRVVSGTAFIRIVEADMITNKGWAGCGFYEDFENFAEVMTHEMGHMLGFDHSPDKNATMYPVAHFDGRGASLGATDKAGMVFAYPGSGTTPQTYTLSVVRAGAGSGSVASSPAGITCGSDCSEAYAQSTGVDLTPAAVAGSHFTGWSGACTGTGPCHVTMSGNLSVTANFALDSTGGTGGSTGGTTTGADLVVSAITLLDTTTPHNKALRVTDTVTNAGSAVARASQVVYYLSTTPQRTASSVKLSTVRSVVALAPGASSTGQLKLYAKVPAGSYHVIACADGNGHVTEGNETNNCTATGTKLTVTP